jgi:autophagy-related protein 9
LYIGIFDISSGYYTNQLEFNIRLAVFNDIDNINVNTVKKKFYLFGFLNLIFSPVIFFYLLFYFFTKNVQEIYTNTNNNISSRRFNLLTKWKIRQYNELKHFFEKRIYKAIPLSNFYLKQFPNPIVEIFGRTVTILCGICFTFNLLLSIIDENVLLHVKIFDRSLLFYTGIIGVISSFSRSLLKNPEDTLYNPTKYMKKINECIKYLPAKWKNKFHTYDVRDDFVKIFPLKILLLIYDLCSVVTTPFILLFHLPDNSKEIVEFITTNTIYIKKVGNVCKCSYVENILNDKCLDRSIILFKENHEIVNQGLDEEESE